VSRCAGERKKNRKLYHAELAEDTQKKVDRIARLVEGQLVVLKTSRSDGFEDPVDPV